jgi:sterol desaturase/sphingolipid hydroxylase (fatty acid hydroxylase superfamily)
MSEPNKHWLMRSQSISLLWKIFIAILVVTVLAELLIHKHEYFGLDGSFGFSAWYGFLTCTAMVVAAKVLGYVLKRGEDYYDD